MKRKLKSIIIFKPSTDGFSQELSRLEAQAQKLQSSRAVCRSTNIYFRCIGQIHDVEAYQGLNETTTAFTVFASHWGHLCVVLVWLASIAFHIGWGGNYELWISNPALSIPVAHQIWDPHFGAQALKSYAFSQGNSAFITSFSGAYNWLLTCGFRSNIDIFKLALSLELCALSALLLGALHITLLKHGTTMLLDCRHPILLRLLLCLIDLSERRLNFHLGSLVGFSSILWSGHLTVVALPASRGRDFGDIDLQRVTKILLTGNWALLAQNIDTENHIFGSPKGSGTAVLTFSTGLNMSTSSIPITDIIHHHLAVGILFLWATSMLSSVLKAFGYKFRAAQPSKPATLSPHLILGLSLAALGVLTSSVAHQIYYANPYAFLAYDSVTEVALYLHHQFIASFLMIGAFAHGSIYLIRDHFSTQKGFIKRLLDHRSAVISHLSWISLFLGFHILGVFVHNDCVVGFGEADKQILVEPVFAQLILKNSSLYSNLSPGDWMACHSIALGLHVSTLILLKGSLDSRGTSFMPDKINFGFGFACDGPGRGGTCDISSWDSVYLATFWALNSIAWAGFYFHFKLIGEISRNSFQFEQSSTYLNGWFRDYLWFNSASILNGYNLTGVNDLSVWSWLFLFGHLVWATGFMFLISWRGYWQELVDVILSMHLKTPILFDLWDPKYSTPVALSIVQARFIGLTHFSVGFILTYAAFTVGATR